MSDPDPVAAAEPVAPSREPLVAIRGPDEVLRPRRSGDPRARRYRSRHPGGRLRCADGAFGLGQVHAAQPAGRDRQAVVGRNPRRGRRHRAACRGGARRMALGQRGFHLPVLQSDAGARCLRQRRAAAPADVAVAQGSPRTCRDRAGAGGPDRPEGALPERALRWPAAARGDRPGAHRRPDAHRRRRAHR